MSREIELILTIGVPGSGKSTWAEKESQVPGTFVVCLDDYRTMLRSGGKYKFTASNEKLIKRMQLNAIVDLVDNPTTKRIIVANTNLNANTRQSIVNRFESTVSSICAKGKVTFKEFDLSWVDVLKRDHERPAHKRVPIERLRVLYHSMEVYKGTAVLYVPNENLPKAVIFDIDGTLANNNHRSPYDLETCDKDTPIDWVVDMLKMYKQAGHKIILVSGRHEGKEGSPAANVHYRELTENWLRKHQIPYDEFHMRFWSDRRKDDLVKSDIFWKKIEPNYNVVCAVDDRDRVVEMWRRIGVKCAQVNFGEF